MCNDQGFLCITLVFEHERQTLKFPLNLTVTQLNAEGYLNKKAELQNFLREINIDVMCIQENHIKEEHMFFVRGFRHYLRKDS